LVALILTFGSMTVVAVAMRSSLFLLRATPETRRLLRDA
jgi:hypothetical protein